MTGNFDLSLTESIPSWQQELACAFSSLDDLCAYLELDLSKVSINPKTHQEFPFKVTRDFASRMNKSDITDPLLRQVLPLSAEAINPIDFVENPVGDLEAIAVPGVLHKYQGRALLIVSGGCAINCRYCFRKNFPYAESRLSKQKIAPAIEYISQRTDLKEIILSGGDPLILSNRQLEDLIRQIANIPHIRRLRIHSRLPNVLPSRIDPGLISILVNSRFKVIVVTHINHPNELDQQVENAVGRLRRADIPVFNQAVLLKGINDDAETLTALCEILFDAGILPYYLHALDKAKGTHHFDVSETKRQQLQQILRRTLPGYLIPKFVSEQTGKPYKIPL